MLRRGKKARVQDKFYSDRAQVGHNGLVSGGGGNCNLIVVIKDEVTSRSGTRSCAQMTQPPDNCIFPRLSQASFASRAALEWIPATPPMAFSRSPSGH